MTQIFLGPVMKPPFRTFSTSPFVVRDFEVIYTGPTVSWPLALRINPLAQVTPDNINIFEHFFPNSGTVVRYTDGQLMYTEDSDTNTGLPVAASVRQVSSDGPDEFDYFERAIGTWETLGTVRTHGFSAPAIDGTKSITTRFQFAYDSDLTNILAEFEYKLTYNRTA
jgi:hypothetical protein